MATDKTPLPIPNQFGVPVGTAINQNGDFAFIGNDNNSLFFRAANSSSASLVLQAGDSVPGFPGSVLQSFWSTLSLNSSRALLFEATFSLPDGLSHAALLTFDGTNVRTIISSGDVAPGSGGGTYGTSIIPGSINDNGDIDFGAVPTGKSAITYFIVPAGGNAVRVLALDDAPPAACTWCRASFQDFLLGVPLSASSIAQSVPGLNSIGQMLIGYDGGLFIGSKDGLALVPRANSGGCSPPPAPAFQPVFYAAALNNLGVVAFVNTPMGFGNTLCIAPSIGGPPVAALTAGTAAPAAIGGTLASISVSAIDDAGDILFSSQISGGATTYALFRYHQSTGQIDLVAYNGEVVPGPNGATFASPTFTAPVTSPSTPPTILPLPAFNSISMANDGRVSFNVSLLQGGPAIYQQIGTAVPAQVILFGQTALPAGGGILSPHLVLARIL